MLICTVLFCVIKDMAAIVCYGIKEFTSFSDFFIIFCESWSQVSQTLACCLIYGILCLTKTSPNLHAGSPATTQPTDLI